MSFSHTVKHDKFLVRTLTHDAHMQVSGPAGSYSEEPPSVDPETARISENTMQGMKVSCSDTVAMLQQFPGSCVVFIRVHSCCSMPPVTIDWCNAQEKIMDALETDRVSVSDTYGDGRHVSIDVVSPVFDGMSSVKRQQKVYKVCTVSGWGACCNLAAQLKRLPECAVSFVAIGRDDVV